ncbi:MAG: hypothetical protein ABIN91_05345 [Mucilaginibacter sp.]|uniref:hypothetical protein n=1 Tax=Mucilaginibacter sp. TaxID=1882438 RepID=UPI00326487E5
MNLSIKQSSGYIRQSLQNLSHDGFKKIFENINLYGIKKSVDKRGLDGFINHCARLAAGTGAIAGSGGAITMIASLPIDVVNNITQQFRVTLAIIYYKRGTYQISFEEFMSIIATSMKVEAGVAITKTMLEEIAEKLLLKMGSKTAGRLIPIFGAAIGGTANYLFVKGVAKAVKEMKNF